VGADGAESADAVGEDQGVAVGAVFEGVEQAFLGGEAGDEVEVGFAGLHAVFAGLVLGADVAAQVAQILLGQYAGDDVGRGLALEDAPVGTQAEARQGGLDHRGVTGAAKAGVALLKQADQAVDVAHRGVMTPNGEHRGEIEHAVEVDGREVTDQLQFKLEGLREPSSRVNATTSKGSPRSGLKV
jgi:hypothetical protein